MEFSLNLMQEDSVLLRKEEVVSACEFAPNMIVAVIKPRSLLLFENWVHTKTLEDAIDIGDSFKFRGYLHHMDLANLDNYPYMLC